MFWKMIKDLQEFLSTWSVKLDQPDNLKPFRRQLWAGRLQDLSGGVLGFAVELFFLALKQLLSTSSESSKESHSEFYIGTFRAVTARGSDTRDRDRDTKNSFSTWLCHIGASFSTFTTLTIS